MLENESNQERKEKYYFILIRFWRTTNDEEVLKYILESLSKEEDYSFIASRLSFIGLQYRPIKDCIPNLIKFFDRGDINFKIIVSGLFSRVEKKIPDMEDKLLILLTKTKDKNKALTIASALWPIGSEKSVNSIKSLMNPIGKNEYDSLILRIVSDLCGGKCVNFYKDNFIHSRNKHVKNAALVALYKYSDDMSIADNIFDRAKTILSRSRKREIAYQENYPPPLVYCLMYLQKIKSDLFDKLLEIIKTDKSKLFEAEKRHIKNKFNLKI